MCDIFPEVPNCLFLITLRIGMLLISILAIMTGFFILSVMEQKSGASYDDVRDIAKIRKSSEAVSKMGKMMSTGISSMGCIFMFTGVTLYFATLFDGEGGIQVFVWLTFTNVILGFFMVLGTAFECLTKPVCILSEMDWLSGSIVLVMITAYLFVWIYFIVVANSYLIVGSP